MNRTCSNVRLITWLAVWFSWTGNQQRHDWANVNARMFLLPGSTKTRGIIKIIFAAWTVQLEQICAIDELRLACKTVHGTNQSVVINSFMGQFNAVFLLFRLQSVWKWQSKQRANNQWSTDTATTNEHSTKIKQHHIRTLAHDGQGSWKRCIGYRKLGYLAKNVCGKNVVCSIIILMMITYEWWRWVPLALRLGMKSSAVY